MTTLKPKDFIKTCLVDELASMIDEHPYISFIIIGIGIEFLGKSINNNLKDWNVRRRSKKDFEEAIINIPSLQKYTPYLTTHDLYGSLRCGLAHAVSPKFKITLSSKHEMGHMIEDSGRLNLKIEDFYQDFKLACEYVINRTYLPDDKMNEDFLQVPGTSFNSGTDIVAGKTGSLDDTSSQTPPFSVKTFGTA